ncbi:hypothetical protein ABI59_13670 [Acidobacteria bacterium Mor1]|nr:hypothetical protein ABI59_13670 [Acidobacteria bacterium Mor1]
MNGLTRAAGWLALMIFVFSGATAGEEMCQVVVGVTATAQDFKGGQFSGNSSDDGNGFQVGFVYKFSESWGVEGGYADLGETDFDGTFLFNGSPVSDVGNIEATAWEASALYEHDSEGKVAFLARIGAARFDVEENEIFGGVPEFSEASGTSPLIGVGATVDLAGRFGLRFEGRRYFDVGEVGETGEGDLDTFGVALTIGF